MKQEIIDKINRLASQDEPFLFVINYQADEAFIRKLSDINPEECLFDFEGKGNFSHTRKETWKEEISETTWQIEPPLYEDYEQSFNIVKSNIMAGNSYLTNLTNRVPVSCNLSLEEIFHRAKGKYKLLLRRKRTQAEDKAHLKEENIEENLTPFVCFSPETFVRIKGGRIYSYPMKGTLDASLPNAEKLLMEDRKEAAEHATIVDLIRNDLSRVAEDVRVDKYRYVDVLHTNKGDILQTSSEISGRLPEDYPHHLGEILDAQLPAGSITGAPKDKTMQIIQEAEGYDRGFYTGIMGIYDQGELNSAVMIRFIEEEETSPVDFEADGEKNFKANEGKKPKIVFQGRRRHHFEERLPEGIRGSDSENLPSDLNPPFILEKIKEIMKQQFVETIKIKNGKALALPYHQARMERTIRRFFPTLASEEIKLSSLISPKEEMNLYKARVVYDIQGVEAIEYAPYKMKEIHSLKVVEDDEIDYTYKSTDRSALNALVAQKDDCDEIIIVKNGLITDTSFTNLALFDGNRWLTPKHPLLQGTKRAQLLEAGIILEADLTLENLRKAEKVSLFNAMIDFGEREVTKIFLPDQN